MMVWLSPHVAVRAQFSEVVSLFPHLAPGIELSSSGFLGMYLYH